MEDISYYRVSTDKQAKEDCSLTTYEAWVRAYRAVAVLSLILRIRHERVRQPSRASFD